MADHIKPHKGNWTLFVSLENLWGLCTECNAVKTAAEDGGFGNAQFIGTRPETNAATITGEPGKPFQSSTVSTKKLDAALAFDAADLLSGIPDL